MGIHDDPRMKGSLFKVKFPDHFSSSDQEYQSCECEIHEMRLRHFEDYEIQQAKKKAAEEERIAGKKKRADTTEAIGNDFNCPITMNPFQDPVMTADGHTYERDAIRKWFQQGKRTSPKTGLMLANRELRPNPLIKAIMDTLRANN